MVDALWCLESCYGSSLNSYTNNYQIALKVSTIYKSSPSQYEHASREGCLGISPLPIGNDIKSSYQ